MLNSIKKIGLIFFLIHFSFSHAQQGKLQGKVTDSLQQPLAYANLLAVPQSDALDITFAITDDKGNYKLKLIKNEPYNITVSYLGYTSQQLNLSIKEDYTKNFVLTENPDQLDTVELNYTPAVSVKKDTITYRVDKFTKGTERKLREVLKTLPGVEVDRAGNVTVQGKKVTKVLVENKTFFTGNSKLAVNNIPADAVDKIEILDNYNDVAMLKNLQDSEDMAMNIKLKEDKKKFAFGDIEAGVGLTNRYVLHPNLFYYSPKTNVNFIGDLNNTGFKSFTFRDYLEFEGGFGKLLQDMSGYFSLYNNDFSKYLSNQDYISNRNQFGALNIRQSLSDATDLSAYVISSNSKTETQQQSTNTYNLADNNTFVEQRTNTNTINNFFTIGKLSLDYDPSAKTDIAFHSMVKTSNNDAYGNVTTQSINSNQHISTLNDNLALHLKQHISANRKLSKTHTGTFEATYTYQNDKPITHWITNQPILEGLIPLEVDDIYNILQTKKSHSHQLNAIVKDYWVLNNFNHLYTSMGSIYAHNTFYSNEVQQLSNGNINNFSSDGFGNDFKYKFWDAFLGLEYKFQIGITTFKPAIFAHYYHWSTQQFEVGESFNKTLLLPQFTSKIEFNTSEKINIRYRLNARFPAINRLANNFILSNFNSVYKGNSNLEEQRYHTISFSYYKFSLFRNLNLNANIAYNRKTKHFKNISQLEGIEQYNTAILFDEPEQNLSIRGSIAKKIKKIRYKLALNYSYSNFYQIVNDNTHQNFSNIWRSTISAETFFKKAPNLEIGYIKDFNNYKSFSGSNQFENDNWFARLEHRFLKDFVIKADYSFEQYQDRRLHIKNTFDNANASIFYQKEDQPWSFEFSVSNVFDTSFKQQNTFSSFLISDSRTFILPRILMFKVGYKL